MRRTHLKELPMIDMNQVLSKVMGAGVGQGEPAATPGSRQLSRQRILPLSSNQAQPAGGPSTGSSLLDQFGALGVGAAAGGLTGSLLGSKKMREMAGTVLQVGAVAAIGGLAYKAYQNYRQGRPVVPEAITDLLPDHTRPSVTAAEPHSALEAWIPPRENSGETATLILQTLIAAAAADGELDKAEYGRIREQLLASGFNGEEQLVLSQLIMRPCSIEQLAASAKTLEQRVEMYTAARLTVGDDTPAEREWLAQLATALQIEPQLKAHVDAIQTKRPAEAA
jgi:uncharacterized membrane protein YebE (DUF533 family)